MGTSEDRYKLYLQFDYNCTALHTIVRAERRSVAPAHVTTEYRCEKFQLATLGNFDGTRNSNLKYKLTEAGSTTV